MYDVAVVSKSSDPFENLALEESLLESPRLPSRAMLLYVDRPCVVIGRNQNPWIEVSPSAGVPILRRISGGGAVFHDEGNLNWSLIAPRDEHDRDAELAMIAAALALVGAKVEADKRGALRVAGTGPYAGAKVSGTARRITRDLVLHHGTLLLRADLARMTACLGGLRALRSSSPASFPSRVANLSSLAPGLGVEEVSASLARALTGREAEPAEPYAAEASRERAEARLRSRAWTWDSTPPFSLEAGGGSALLEIRSGLVAAVSGPRAGELACLVGSGFGYGTAADAEAILARCAK